MADNHMTFLMELCKVSSRATAMERQSPPTVQTGITTHEQSLNSTQLSREQSPQIVESHAEQ